MAVNHEDSGKYSLSFHNELSSFLKVMLRKHDLKPGTLKARLLETLVTTLTYSPVMTLIMVWMAWKQATSHSTRIPFGPMLLKSEIISLIGAFVISFLAAPLWTSLVMKRVNSSPE